MNKNLTKNILWRSQDIWRRKSGYVVRYRCFENLNNGMYTVQSADFYRLPLDQETSSQHEERYLELLIEEDPGERNKLFQTIEEAIAAHDAEFDNEE